MHTVVIKPDTMHLSVLKASAYSTYTPFFEGAENWARQNKHANSQGPGNAQINSAARRAGWGLSKRVD